MDTAYRRCARALFAAALVSTVVAGLGRTGSVSAADNPQNIVAEWPEPARFTAQAMIEKYGKPDRADDESITWFGLYGGRRTTVRRTDVDGNIVEQSVSYKVPEKKAADVANFDSRIKTDEKASEMSVRTENARTNFLVLNLAHEIASGFKSVDEARAFRDRQLQLAQAGKSSRYRDGLLFEAPTQSLPAPFSLPGGVNPPPDRRMEP